MSQYVVFIILAPLAGFLSIGLAAYSWIHDNARGARTLALYLTAVSGLLVANLLNLLSPTISAKWFWSGIEYFFYAFGPVAWLAFSLQYTGKDKWLEWKRFRVFLVIPTISFILVLTNPWHHLVWTDASLISVGGFRNLNPTNGTWFPIFITYTCALILIGATLIGMASIRAHEIYRRQSLWIIIGAVSPLVVTLAYYSRAFPGFTKDYSPLAWAFAGAAFAIGIFKHRLLNLTPIARTTLVDNMRDGLIVLDNAGQIVDVNPAFRKIISLPENRLIGVPVDNVLRIWKDLSINPEADEWTCEVALSPDGQQVFYDMRVIRIRDLGNLPIGRLITLHDITERKQLLATVEKLATTDSLTGLYNRRYFMEMAEKEMERSLRYGHSVAILMIDLDHFKSVNDLHGHGVGDQVLLGFSHELLDSLRRMDLLARYGGEEFIILLPETTLMDARGLAERLCNKMAQKTLVTAVGPISITISIGVAGMVVEDPVPLAVLIEKADNALYDAKNKGRNRISWVEVREYQYKFPQI
jgi:diguanylate cyclase (GGDEF)-like protein/PAS domain S-box-containing protein